METRNGLRRGWRAVAAVAVAGLVPAGCSSVPDELNPIVWYEAVEDLVTGNGSEAEPDRIVISDRDAGVPGADEPFPNLASVPDQVPATESSAQRRAIADGLVADRANARYTDEAVRRDTADSPAAAPAPNVAAAPVVAPPPAPAPSPAPPVETRTETVEPPPAAVARTDVPEWQAPSPGRPRTSREAYADYAEFAGPDPALEQLRHVDPAPVSAPPAMASATPPAPAVAAPVPAPMPESRTAASPVYEPAPIPAARSAAPAAVASPPAAAPRDDYQGVFAQYFAESGRTPATAPRRDAYEVAGVGPAPAGNLYPRSPGGQPAGVITFESSSSRLSDRDLGVVRQIADAYRSYGGRLRVVGHASSRTLVSDPVKHRQANLRVSMQRAKAVAEALQRSGVPADAIAIAAVADSDPLYSEATPLGEAANRRAEIYFDYTR